MNFFSKESFVMHVLQHSMRRFNTVVVGRHILFLFLFTVAKIHFIFDLKGVIQKFTKLFHDVLTDKQYLKF